MPSVYNHLKPVSKKTIIINSNIKLLRGKVILIFKIKTEPIFFTFKYKQINMQWVDRLTRSVKPVSFACTQAAGNRWLRVLFIHFSTSFFFFLKITSR